MVKKVNNEKSKRKGKERYPVKREKRENKASTPQHTPEKAHCT